MSCRERRGRRGSGEAEPGGVADVGDFEETGCADEPCSDAHSPPDVGSEVSPSNVADSNLTVLEAEITIPEPISITLKHIDIRDESMSDTTSVSDDTPPSTPRSQFSSSSATSSRSSLRRRKSGLQDARVSSSSSPARDEPSKRHKRNLILKALSSSPPDVASLRQLAISRGGLLEDSLRKRAWPCLLDIDVTSIPDKPDIETLHGHRDYEQVILDVKRSMKRFPPGMEEEVRLSYQDQLVDCIMWVLVCHPDLHYYQGFHDIVVTFLLVVGENLTFAIMDKLCQKHLRDFMEVTMEKTNYILHYLLPLIGKASPQLRKFLEDSEVGTMFCLSWLITWYGHVLSEFRHIVRLYDFFMACHPLMPIYLAADIVLYRKDDVLACMCEMPCVHSLLSRIPDDLPFELLITRAGDLFIQYPPNILEDEARQQYEKFVQEIQQRREEGLARRAANTAGRGGKTVARLPVGAAGNHGGAGANLFTRVTVYGVVFAAVSAAVALTYLRKLEWPGWWTWTPS